MQLSGVVVEGKKEARKLGYPTANLEYCSAIHSDKGVWICWSTLKGKRYPALAVVGMWQLATGEPSLEIHILDFTENIYGQVVDVSLEKWIRPLEKFPNIEDLKIQIEKDIQTARMWLSNNS